MASAPIVTLRPVDHHVAQVNIGRLVAPADSEQLAGFFAALDRVNAAADGAPGFVWRLQTEEGNATSVVAFEWDQSDSHGVLVNMSVWESIEQLAAFVYGDLHRAVLRGRRRLVPGRRRGNDLSVVGPGRPPPLDRRGRGPSASSARPRLDPGRLHLPALVWSARQRRGFGAPTGSPRLVLPDLSTPRLPLRRRGTAS